jgi:threonine dehydrogenase-like Zn-dependent dehydrogenase
MDLDDKKLEFAKKQGVDTTVNSKNEDPVKAISFITIAVFSEKWRP